MRCRRAREQERTRTRYGCQSIYTCNWNSYHRRVSDPSSKRDASRAALAFIRFEPHCVLATWRNVAIAIWIQDTGVDYVKRAQLMVHQLASQWPEGVAFLQIFGEDHASIESDARGALNELLRSAREIIREAPVVYEGSGFRAAAIRALVTSLFSQRSLGFPHRVYSSVDEAALSIGRRFEKREPARLARELCEALAALRDRHHSEFPTAPQSFIRYRG